MASRYARQVPDVQTSPDSKVMSAGLEVAEDKIYEDGGDDVFTRGKKKSSCRNDGKASSNENDQHVNTSKLLESKHNPSSASSKKHSTASLNVRKSTVQFYEAVCKKFRVLPLRNVALQFGRRHVSLKNLTLTTLDVKAACLALQNESVTASLDVTGNFMGATEMRYCIMALARLDKLFQMSLAHNCLSGEAVADLSRFLVTNSKITRVDLSGNSLNDKDAGPIAQMLMKNTALQTLVLSHNAFREEGGRVIGQALAVNSSLEDIDLSWNHLRRCGAVGIAKGLQINRSLRSANLAWNGFGFEGCVAMGDMLSTNTSIVELDLTCNRINPPALLELLRGVAANKVLRILKVGHNPITSAFSSLILAVVRKHKESGLENIDMTGVVVDKEFVQLLEAIQCDRFFLVNYELSLPVKQLSREEMRERIGLPSAFNVDPLRMLYLLKEKMRASDFFYKINKDNDYGLQRSELYSMFDESGIPVTGSVIDKIMEFMDTNKDGTIDLSEFLRGDKRIKNISRKQIKGEQERRVKDTSYTKYSRTFQKAHIDPITNALKVDPSPTPMRQSRRPSIVRPADDDNQFKIP